MNGRRRRGWWGYVKWVIRDQPTKIKELEALRHSSGGGGIITAQRAPRLHRPAENAALRALPGWAGVEFVAVERAIEETRQLRDGELRLRFIDMVFWRKSHNLDGAAMECYISHRTAVRWHGDFIRRVGANIGFDV